MSDWISAGQPPPFNKDKYGWKRSMPVLCLTALENVLLATYEQNDETNSPCWRSYDSDRKNVTEDVIFWCVIPDLPTIGSCGTCKQYEQVGPGEGYCIWNEKGVVPFCIGRLEFPVYADDGTNCQAWQPREQGHE